MVNQIKAIDQQMISRIAEIDKMFDEADGWGSWMMEASKERVELVEKLAASGVFVEHKHRITKHT